nr:hypothetical protein SEVIR_9G383400v2 [Setaria viridis]
MEWSGKGPGSVEGSWQWQQSAARWPVAGSCSPDIMEDRPAGRRAFSAPRSGSSTPPLCYRRMELGFVRDRRPAAVGTAGQGKKAARKLLGV